MERAVPVRKPDDILPEYRETPVGRLLAYHNLEAPFGEHTSAELLVGMCMDHRKSLRLPERFAYVVRTGGANLRFVEFQVSFAIGVGGVGAIAVIGHTDCGMVNLAAGERAFIDGLAERAGWDRRSAEEHFAHLAPLYEIGNAVDFTLAEAERLRRRYPEVRVAPLLYRIEDDLLYQLR